MAELIKHLRFTKRSIPIPPDYRPLYKIGHILLILNLCSRSDKASLLKLHFLTWAVKNKRNIEIVNGWIKNDFKSDFHIWGIEPTLNRALIFAVADNLIKEENGQFQIESRGLSYVKLILNEPEIFSEEIDFLKKLGKTTITEKKIQELSSKLF